MNPVRPDSRARARAPWSVRLDGLLDLLAPATCASCGAALRPPTADRHDAIARLFCAPCEMRLDLDPKTRSPRPVGRGAWPVHAPLPYVGDGEEWLRRVKYPASGLSGLDAHARAFVRALAGRAAETLAPPDAILPVPLHRSAFLQRGFNPALRWARALGRATGAPVLARALVKCRRTRPQKGLGIVARRENVRDAFALSGQGAGVLTHAAHVWLADDVVTTGATLEACVEALLARGITCSGVAVCIARTPRSGEALTGRSV